MCGGAAPDHHGHLARVGVELLAFTNCAAGCTERSYKNPCASEIEGSVDDVAALLKRNKKEVAVMSKKVTKKLKEEVEKKGLKLSLNENGKGRKRVR